MDSQTPAHLSLAHRIAESFRSFSNVEGIALAGSQAGGAADRQSDIDLYVYTRSVIALVERAAVIERLGATRSDLNLQFWDLGDEWHDNETDIEVDVIYWDTCWIEGQLDRVLIDHQAGVAYSTCHWHTIRNSVILYDRGKWLHGLKDRAAVPYPERLRQAVIAKNHPLIRRAIPSYLHQIEKAVRRKDIVSVNHRVAALLASYFDVLFALNRLPNPGEKRLLKEASEQCEIIPRKMVNEVTDVLRAVSSAGQGLIDRIEDLADGLDRVLLDEGFDPETSVPVQ